MLVACFGFGGWVFGGFLVGFWFVCLFFSLLTYILFLAFGGVLSLEDYNSSNKNTQFVCSGSSSRKPVFVKMKGKILLPEVTMNSC